MNIILRNCAIIIYIVIYIIVYIISYVPRLARVVNVLAIRQVKQGTELLGCVLCTRVNMLAVDLIFL